MGAEYGEVPRVTEIAEMGKMAKAASRRLVTTSAGLRNGALEAIADALIAKQDEIVEANAKDMEAARAKGTSESLLDRLMLNEDRVADMAQGLRDVAALPDPVGQVIAGWRVPNGLLIEQVRVPLGVIGIIYEARPNVTIECAALAVKSGNAVILRGGSMAVNSNLTLSRIAAEAGAQAGLPDGAIQSVESTDRESAGKLMRLNEYLDLLVPRGGPDLIAAVVENAKVPVLWAGAGNCHVYVDASADLVMARRIVVNAKCQRPSVCNAAETLLVHKDVAKVFLEPALKELAAKGVSIKGCAKTCEIFSYAEPATEEDWRTEFLDLIIAVRVVDGVEEAIDHISTYGTMHSEAIITNDYLSAKKFTEQVDSAAVYVNASTRFTDGGQFGLGAEIGISTQKLHARGPMGLAALTSVKWVIHGEGQARP